ncbi:MAG TPA: hypothetical protein VMP08_22990 [Anaerolineae bacterium]|nr:hypothetical protein [Anaerolineae bacterium]
MNERDAVTGNEEEDQAPLPQVRSIQPAEIIQAAQTQVGQLQMTYRDTDLKFWALALAWETLRLAWYVIEGNTALACQEKLPLVQQALADFDSRALRQIESTPRPNSDND